MVQGLSGNVGFRPHIEGADDGRALPSLLVGEPEQQLRDGNFTPVPLLTGTTKHETANAFTIDAINQVFGSAEQFLGSLTELLTDLTGLLRVDKLTGEIIKPVLPGLTGALTPTLNEVLKVPETLNLDQIISKVISATTDILFNLPAVLSAQVWSQLAPAFMYSFEYNGTKSKGINFLRGLPIVAMEENPDPEIVAHGDELGYMFDVNDIFGNPVESARLTDPTDLKVRKNFIGMLVKFAKSFKGDTKANSVTDSLFRSVTGGGGIPFIKVDSEVKSESDFRFCELSVLGAPLQPLTKMSCAGLNSLLNPVGGVLGGVGGTLGGALGGNTGGGGAGGGLLGGLTPKQPPRKDGAGAGGLGLIGGGGLLG